MSTEWEPVDSLAIDIYKTNIRISALGLPIEDIRYAARILRLGLTAYGPTEYAAVMKLGAMLREDVRIHMELETAAEWWQRSKEE